MNALRAMAQERALPDVARLSDARGDAHVDARWPGTGE